MTGAERSASRRSRLISSGLCVRCGKRPPRQWRRECGECASKHAACALKHFRDNRIVINARKRSQYCKDRQRERREARKSVGVCINCNQKAIAGQTRCEYHAKKQREALYRFTLRHRIERAREE